MGGATPWTDAISDTIQPPPGPLGHRQPGGIYPKSRPQSNFKNTLSPHLRLLRRQVKGLGRDEREHLRSVSACGRLPWW